MRKLVYLVATTLDGYIAGIDRGNPDFLPSDGPHMADMVAEFPEMIPGHVRGHLGLAGVENRRFDTVLMGRATYDIGLTVGVTSPYPHLRQYVVSRSLSAPPDPAVRLIGRDVVESVRALKAEDGKDGKDIWLCGGGKLAAVLVDEVDEMILKINPVILGEGVPLFDGPMGPKAVTVTEQKLYPNGYTVLRCCWTG